MEKLPLLISAGCFLAWCLSALFMTNGLRTAARGLGLGFALIQLGSSIWAAVRVLGDAGEGAVQYGGIWLSMTSDVAFEVKCYLDAQGAVLWLVLSILASTLAYFGLLRQLRGEAAQLRGDAVSTPLISLGALSAIVAANLLSYLFGWALVAAGGFLAIGFSAPNREDRASAALRYFALNFLPEVIFLAGLLGCYAGVGSTTFATMNSKGLAGFEWAIACLVIGSMLRSLQMPLMQSVRYLAVAREAAVPVYFIGHVLLASTLFAKIQPLIASTEVLSYFAVLPALTAVVAAVLALAESDVFQFVGWLASYICSSIFLSGLVGHYQAAQALAVAGTVVAFLFALSLTELPEDSGAGCWLSGIALFALTGAPLSAFGWARYLEYAGLVQTEGPAVTLRWSLLGLKILADLVMAVALWGVVRERWLGRARSSRVPWESVLPLALLTILSLAAAVGGRPFGGIAGQIERDAYPGAAWFERLILPPQGAAGSSLIPDSIASDADLFGRIIVIGVFLLAALVAGLWLYRDKRSVNEFRSGCRRLIERVSGGQGPDPLLWSWLVRPISALLGAATNFIEKQVLDYAMTDLWVVPVRLVRDAFRFIEERVIDSWIVDGLADAFSSVGKSLRIVQNGQVQFYFALGLVLMGSVVIKFVIWGGAFK